MSARDEGRELEARELIELARDALVPGEEDRARVRAALVARLGAAAGLGAAASVGAAAGAGGTSGFGGAAGLGGAAKVTSAVGAATSAGVAGTGAATAAGVLGAGAAAAKLIAAAVLVSATLGVSATVIHRHRRATIAAAAAVPANTAPRSLAGKTAAPVGRPGPSPAPSSEEAASTEPARADAPPPPRSPVRPAAMPADPPPIRAATKRKVSPAAVRAAPTPVADEAGLVHDGVLALRAGQPARALELFDRHARLYPRGVLAEERDAERALALADLGRSADARAAIDEFLQAHPASPLARRLSERKRLIELASP